MVVLLDEQFLVHSAVHRAVLRLVRTCVREDTQEQLDGRSRILGAAGSAIRSRPSEYEEDCAPPTPAIGLTDDFFYLSGQSSMYSV